MPNWFTNRLHIRGPAQDVQLLKDFVATPESLFDFNTIIPQPHDLYQGDLSAEDRERTRGWNWHSWNSNNWGTKWNAHSPWIDRHDKFKNGRAWLIYWFDTAWDAPRPIAEYLPGLFPELQFHWYGYHEDGWQREDLIVKADHELADLCRSCVPSDILLTAETRIIQILENPGVCLPTSMNAKTEADSNSASASPTTPLTLVPILDKKSAASSPAEAE